MIIISDLTKVYKRGREEVRALDRVSFAVEDGEFVTLFGPSAAGKTTLLNIIGGLDLPTEGKVSIFGKELTRKQMVNSRRTIPVSFSPIFT